MVVVVFSDNQVLVYDCNIHDDNEKIVLNYLANIIPKNSIDVFVNSHRDADHMRGVKRLHNKFPIRTLWDSGVVGNNEAPEYRDYMDFRRNVGNVHEVTPGQHWKDGKVKVLNGKRDKSDANSQSIVLHISNGSSAILAGDTDAKVWRDYIIPESSAKIKSDILLGSHHGSITFFDDPRDEKNYYIEHVKKINPAMTIISVGENPHGHPDDKALELYEKYSRGSDKGNKVFRTDINGNMKLLLKDDGGWTLSQKQ